jgi:hypothetical protein
MGRSIGNDLHAGLFTRLVAPSSVLDLSSSGKLALELAELNIPGYLRFRCGIAKVEVSSDQFVLEYGGRSDGDMKRHTARRTSGPVLKSRSTMSFERCAHLHQILPLTSTHDHEVLLLDLAKRLPKIPTLHCSNTP